jgi:hypothetical protein
VQGFVEASEFQQCDELWMLALTKIASQSRPLVWQVAHSSKILEETGEVRV